jgi:ribosome biogenesis GTPase
VYDRIYVEFDDRGGAAWRDALCEYGFDEIFLKDYGPLAEPGDAPARIIETRRGRYSAVCRDGEGGLREVDAVPSGRLGHEAVSASELPAVGDWVVLRPTPDGPASVRAVLPRRAAFVRKAPGDTAHDRVDAQVIAANVDSAFIVTAAGRDWNPRRIERYLALARESGAEPVIVIAKADLAEDPESLLDEAASIAPDVKRVLACAPEGRGLEELRGLLGAGRTVVLLGSSGAGKSTLLNALAGRELATTGEVRLDDQRGRHTTTHRQLFKLESGALIIDTPGMRELQLWASDGAVDATFPEIEKLASRCRFRDCGHGSEPGCAVRAALEAGEIDESRYESWLKLGKELAFLRYREDRSLREVERRRWKVINKSMRGYSKERRAASGSAR